MRPIAQCPLEAGILKMAAVSRIESLRQVSVNITEVVREHSGHRLISGIEIMLVEDNTIEVEGSSCKTSRNPAVSLIIWSETVMLCGLRLEGKPQ
jgi:hypothetical protein